MKRIYLWTCVALVFVLTGCASTRIVSQWADPDMTTGKYDKIVVVFQHKDSAYRRPLEDAMAAGIPRATPLYKVMSDADARDDQKASNILKAQGFDTLVIMRLVSTEKEVSYVPGTMHMGGAPYARAWGGYGYGWGAVYDPGYMRTDTFATVGTNVYSLATEKLVWTTRSETMNPNTSVELVQEVVKANTEAARKAMGK
jgi:hypothetical protein